MRIASNSPVHALMSAAAGKYLGRMDRSLFTQANVTAQGQNGNCMLHHAAKHGQLPFVPIELLTEANLLIRGEKQNTPFYIACAHGGFPHIPAGAVTHRAMTSRNFRGSTPLHVLASRELLPLVPREFLTRENLLRVNDLGTTPLHLACTVGNVEGIPRELLTREDITFKPKRAYRIVGNTRQRIIASTPLERAHTNGVLGKLPIDLLAMCADLTMEGKPLIQHLPPEILEQVNLRLTAPTSIEDL